MTNIEANEFMELEEMLDEAMDANAVLKEKLENVTNDLVITLEKLVSLQEKFIGFDEPCDCPMCNQ